MAAEAAEAKGKNKKKFVVIAVIALALFGGVAGGFVLFGPSADAAKPGPSASASPSVSPTPEEGKVVEVAQMTTSLSGEDNVLARIGFGLVLSKGTTKSQIEDDFPLLKDAVVGRLASYEPAELRREGALDDLRADITARAKEVYPDGSVVRAVITEFVVR